VNAASVVIVATAVGTTAGISRRAAAGVKHAALAQIIKPGEVVKISPGFSFFSEIFQ
jgi:hypothetical protein